MTTSVKSVTPTEAGNRINDLFGSLSMDQIGVVYLNEDLNKAKLNTNVTLANVADIRKSIEIKLNRTITSEDVAIVKLNEETSTEKSFKVSKANIAGFKDRLTELGFDFDLSKVAVVTAENLGLGNNNNGSGKKLKK